MAAALVVATAVPLTAVTIAPGVGSARQHPVNHAAGPAFAPAMPALALVPQRTDPEAALMERMRDGDQEAVTALVERFQQELVGFFFNLCFDQLLSEELAQDVFVNVYRARTRWVPTAKVRTWMYRIAHNRWIDHCRRRHDHLSLDADQDDGGFRLGDAIAAPAGQSDDPQRAGVIRQRVQAALELLPAGQREVFVLANNHGMKYHEISGVLGIPEGTVKSRMHHAIRILRDELADLVEA